MTITVDVVVIGANERALAWAVASAQDGKRVLVITRQRGPAIHRKLRRAQAAAGARAPLRITMLCGAEVECIGGVRSVEAVLARYLRSGRRVDANTTALMTFEDEPQEQTRTER